ncbi:MAG: CHASE3 domain-containing protein, partial [Cyclobacteriaceae bacterium]
MLKYLTGAVMENKFRFNFITQIIIGFVLTITLLIALSYISYTYNRQYQETSELVAHGSEVLYNAQEVLSISLSIETGQRGFTITGDSSFLLPYTTAVTEVPRHLNDLIKLTADNPDQQERLAS